METNHSYAHVLNNMKCEERIIQRKGDSLSRKRGSPC